MKVLITGATGLIGNEIVKQCHKSDIEVHILTTSKDKLLQGNNIRSFLWNPESGTIDLSCFEGVSVIINLAGSNITKRWTAKYKKSITQSRLQSLQLLRESLKTMGHNVEHLVSASGISIYPDSLTNYYEEDFSQISQTYLGHVVKQWESEADGFKSIGVGVSKVRIGLVLSRLGGALPQMTKPVSLGLGAAFGTGKQWQSWVHVTDLANLFLYLAEHRLKGVYNGVASNPVTNTDLTKALSKQLEKPLFMPNIPKSLMKFLLGEMHILLFESQRVSSKKIEENGFHFQFANIQQALADLYRKG